MPMSPKVRVPRRQNKSGRGRRGAPRSRPTVAVMTVSRDEAVMLPRWVDYYGSQVGLDNLIVLDDNSTDGSTDDLGCTVHRLPGLGGKGFEVRRVRLVSGIAAGLLQVYDVVIFVDVDEFLVPDPTRYDGLQDFLGSHPEPVIAPLAFNVVHHVGVEGPLSPRRPVLDQRSLAKFAPVMCKPSIKRVDARWEAASHGIGAPYAVDPDLFMLHLKFADRDHLHAVADQRQQVVQASGRAQKSSWARSADDIVAVLDELTVGVDASTVPEFDPGAVDLAALVESDDGFWRSRKEGQLPALRKHPLVRIPSQLRGAF